MDNNLEVAPKSAASGVSPEHSLKATTTTQPSTTAMDDIDNPQTTTTAFISMQQQDILNKLDLAPSTLEALKTLSTISSNNGIEKLSNCDKLTASLEQLRAKKNINLFEKLDKIKQEFSGMNHKVSQMENSIMDMRKDTNNLVRSLPATNHLERQYQGSKTADNHNSKQPMAAGQSRSKK